MATKTENKNKEKKGSKTKSVSAKKSRLRSSEEKWGKGVISSGFCMVPSLLLKAQRRLKINGTQLAILFHLADFWWTEGNKPHPSKAIIAERMNIGPRQVQRNIEAMEELGLIKRKARFLAHQGRTSNEYDLSGLVHKLQEINRDNVEVDKKSADEKAKVLKPGLKKRN